MSDFPPVAIERLWPKGCRREYVEGRFQGHRWKVSDLQRITADQPVYEIPLIFLDLGDHSFDKDGGLISFARHMQHVMDADLDYPIILDEWGGILDGRHRIVRALIEGRPTIKAVRVPAGTPPTFYE